MSVDAASGWKGATTNSTFVTASIEHSLPSRLYLESLSAILSREASSSSSMSSSVSEVWQCPWTTATLLSSVSALLSPSITFTNQSLHAMCHLMLCDRVNLDSMSSYTRCLTTASNLDVFQHFNLILIGVLLVRLLSIRYSDDGLVLGSCQYMAYTATTVYLKRIHSAK